MILTGSLSSVQIIFHLYFIQQSGFQHKHTQNIRMTKYFFFWPIKFYEMNLSCKNSGLFGNENLVDWPSQSDIILPKIQLYFLDIDSCYMYMPNNEITVNSRAQNNNILHCDFIKKIQIINKI